MQKKYTVEELMMNDSFLRYCLTFPPADKALWEKEMALNPHQQTIFGEAKYTILLLNGRLEDEEVGRQVDKIKSLINRQDKTRNADVTAKRVVATLSPKSQVQTTSGRLRIRKALLVGGAAAGVLALLVLVFFKNTSSSTIIPAKTAEVIYQSGTGERKTIDLPDGSVAVLNSNSSIQIEKDFSNVERSVILKGEAFFQVAKDAARPFVVRSGTFSVTALGTSFYVQARSSDDWYKVRMLEGKVKLASVADNTGLQGAAGMILQTGEEAAWQSSGHSFTKGIADSAVLRKWLSGRLSFKNMPVEKVLELLQQWYGVDIKVNHKKWTKLKLNGDYDNQPLDHILKIICFSLSAGYSYSGNQVIIE